VETAFVVLPTTAVIGVMVAGAPVAWRSAVALVFFIVSPGLAVLIPARFRLELELAMILPTSLAMTSLVSLALFYAGAWTPTLTVVCLAAVCAFGVLGGAVRGLRPATTTRAKTGQPSDVDPNWGDAT
jgi:hypothetical protein